MSNTQLLTIGSYGQYSNNNYGRNTMYITIGVLILYFSYSTIIAFEIGNDLYISNNEWGVTTGKHLNWINKNHNIRIPHKILLEKLNKVISSLNITVLDILIN